MQREAEQQQQEHDNQLGWRAISADKVKRKLESTHLAAYNLKGEGW
jgi:hypothetical protein